MLIQRKPSRAAVAVPAKEWIEAQYHDPLTLTKIATVARMTPSHFRRIFRRSTGITFRLILSRMRIPQVCKLLADHRNPVAESALAVGFQSISQFNRTFLLQVGQSPSEYRAALFAGRSGQNVGVKGELDCHAARAPVRNICAVYGKIAPSDLSSAGV